MAVLLARSECRGGQWWVVTYDISNPDAWTELGAIATEQACSEQLQIAFEATAASYEPVQRVEHDLGEATRGGAAVLVTPGGDCVSIAHDGDAAFVVHRAGRGADKITCSGYCKQADGTIVQLGPQDCPSGSGGIDCTSKPPRLICT
jgi:hypothetical protein